MTNSGVATPLEIRQHHVRRAGVLWRDGTSRPARPRTALARLKSISGVRFQFCAPFARQPRAQVILSR